MEGDVKSLVLPRESKNEDILGNSGRWIWQLWGFCGLLYCCANQAGLHSAKYLP